MEGNLTRFDCVPSVIMINTDLIGDIEINGYADLLNPELKGKIVFADPQASSSSFEHLVNMLYAMGTDGQPNGWDYVREFCKQLPNGCVNSSSAVYKGVADGEYAVGLTFEQGAATYVSQGNIKVVYMEEGVIIRGDGVYIVKDCPNLDSARKFVDWLTSYDAQTYMNETQFRRTIRTDVPETDAMQSMSTINVITDDETIASETRPPGSSSSRRPWWTPPSNPFHAFQAAVNAAGRQALPLPPLHNSFFHYLKEVCNV